MDFMLNGNVWDIDPHDIKYIVEYYEDDDLILEYTHHILFEMNDGYYDIPVIPENKGDIVSILVKLSGLLSEEIKFSLPFSFDFSNRIIYPSSLADREFFVDETPTRIKSILDKTFGIKLYGKIKNPDLE